MALQNDLNALNNWSKTWIQKKKSVWCFRSKLANVTMLLLLNINLVTTISVASQNNLGTMVTNNLNWKMHIIVGLFISVSTCILEQVFFHLEGMCSDHK